jgi:hypothetical protein
MSKTSEGQGPMLWSGQGTFLRDSAIDRGECALTMLDDRGWKW